MRHLRLDGMLTCRLAAVCPLALDAELSYFSFTAHLSIYLPSLRSLHINFNQLTRIPELGALTQLTELQIKGNNMSDCTRSEGEQACMHRARHHNASLNCSPLVFVLRSSHIEHLSEYRRLELLDLSQNQIGDLPTLLAELASVLCHDNTAHSGNCYGQPLFIRCAFVVVFVLAQR